MFVEVVRMFVVVLGTAAGFWLARDLGDPGSGIEGVGGMLGCLAGYVGGGLLGRLLDRAVGAIDRRAEQLPASTVVAATLGAVGGALAGTVFAVPVVVLAPRAVGLPLAGLVVWVGLWMGAVIVGGKSAAIFEMLGLSTRPLVRAHAYDSRDGLLVDTSVVMDGQLLPMARVGSARHGPAGRAVRPRRAAGLRRLPRRGTLTPGAPRDGDPRPAQARGGGEGLRARRRGARARGRRREARGTGQAPGAAPPHERLRARQDRRDPRASPPATCADSWPTCCPL